MSQPPDSQPEPGAPGSAELTFEQARAELERIVAQLEQGQAELEDAIELWERGDALYRLCLAKLDAAQGRIEHLGRELAEAAPQSGEKETAPSPVEDIAGPPPPSGPDGD